MITIEAPALEAVGIRVALKPLTTPIAIEFSRYILPADTPPLIHAYANLKAAIWSGWIAEPDGLEVGDLDNWPAWAVYGVGLAIGRTFDRLIMSPNIDIID